MIAGPRAGETKIYWDILEVRRVKGEVRKKARNEGRPGYKKTRVGWIPEEWIVKTFDHISNVVWGSSPRPAGSPLFLMERIFRGSPSLSLLIMRKCFLHQPKAC